MANNGPAAESGNGRAKGKSFSLLATGFTVGTVLVTALVLFFAAYRMARAAIEREALRTVGAYADGTRRALINRLDSLHERAQTLITNAWNQCNDEPEGGMDACLTRVLAQFMELQHVEALFLEIGDGRQVRLGEKSRALRFVPGLPPERLATLPSGKGPNEFFTLQTENSAVPGKIVLLVKTKELEPIFSNLSYLGENGEAFLVNGDGFFVTRPKYRVESGISHPIDAVPMKTCLSPQNGEMTAPDYRDVSVIHGFRYVPEVGGGCIMVHIDHAEAMAGLTRFTRRWLAVAAALLAVFGAAAYFTSLRLTEYLLGPLNALIVRIGKAARGEAAAPASIEGGPRELMALSESLQRYSEWMETARVKLAEREQTARSELESRAKMMSDLSHELKTPLTAIMALCRIMDGHEMPEEERRFLKIIHSAGGQLLTLINNSLDMAKLDAGKLTVDRVALDLHAVIQQTLSLLGPIAETKGCRLELRLSMPREHIRGPRFLGDPLRLGQILTNLIGNAIKFTAKGNVTLAVFELARDAAPGARLFRFEVSDTGAGMTPAQMENIFKRFGQADETAAARHGGTGLGLVISKELAELMGGRIGMESEAGKGSTFWFELPLRETEG